MNIQLLKNRLKSNLFSLLSDFMKSFLFFLILLFSFTTDYAQPVHLLKDKRFVQHWKSMKDCSTRDIIENNHKGIILDGCLLQQTDKALISTIESIIGFDSIGTMSVDCTINYDEVADLEYLLFSLQQTSSDEFAIVLLNSGAFYRQYLGLSLSETKYLFVSFKRDESIFHNKRIRKKNYELFKLIYSRIFLFKNIDPAASKFDCFWLLYSPQKNEIISYYYN